MNERRENVINIFLVVIALYLSEDLRQEILK